MTRTAGSAKRLYRRHLGLDGATTQTEVDVLNVVGQGSAPNFTVRGMRHLTVSANGNITALVNHFTSTGDCIPQLAAALATPPGTVPVA